MRKPTNEEVRSENQRLLREAEALRSRLRCLRDLHAELTAEFDELYRQIGERGKPATEGPGHDAPLQRPPVNRIR